MVKYNAVIKNIIAFLLITVCAFAYGVPLSAENSNNSVSDTAKAAAVPNIPMPITAKNIPAPMPLRRQLRFR